MLSPTPMNPETPTPALPSDRIAPPADGASTLPAGSPTVGVRVTGPQQRRVGQLAEFNIEVTNTGAVAIENVRIDVNPEETLRPTGATNGFDTTSGALTWRYGALPAGETVRLQVNCDCVGEANLACVRATVTADAGISQAALACLEILPDPNAPSRSDAEAPPLSRAPAMQPALPNEPEQPPAEPRMAPSQPPEPGNLKVTVTDDVDPARVGQTITYRIAVTNQSSESDRQVVVRANVPELVSVQAIRGSQFQRFQDTLRFTPIAELRAGETVNFEIRCRAISPGAGRVSVDVSSLRVPNALGAGATTEILPGD
jgi:uncharacterized repeat protein (TIGR01451 family)